MGVDIRINVGLSPTVGNQFLQGINLPDQCNVVDVRWQPFPTDIDFQANVNSNITVVLDTPVHNGILLQDMKHRVPLGALRDQLTYCLQVDTINMVEEVFEA